MLLKKDCILAINEWEIVRKNYSRIEAIIDPKSVFSFDHNALNWFVEKSANEYFHAYFGVSDNELTMIVVPLDESGTELDLTSYITASLSPLTEDVVLKEVEVSKTFREATISKSSHISGIRESTDPLPLSEPFISISNSAPRIQSWLDYSLSWFQDECSTYEGTRIFKTFNVYSASLANCDLNASKVYCFFGFKELENMQVPDLIFVAVCDGFASENQYNSSMGILTDFGRPCPPFCPDAIHYNIFK
jgi:hypothetical protein